MAIIKNTNFDPTDRNSLRFINVNDNVASSVFGIDPSNFKNAQSTPAFIRGPVDFTAGGAITTPEKQQEVKDAFNSLPKDVVDVIGNGTDQQVNETIKNVVTQQKDPNQANVPGVDSLTRLAGEANLTVDQFLKLLGKKTQVSPDERKKLEEAAGIPDLITERFTTPTVDTQAKFNELFKASDLPELKQRIKESNDKIAERKRKFLDAKKRLVGNVWISQSTRNARLARERELANDELQLLVDDKKADVELFNRGLELIDDEITRFSKQSEKDRKMTADKLNFLIKQVDRSVKDLEKQREEDNLRFIPEFLKEKIKARKSKSTVDESGVVPVQFTSSEKNTITGLGLADVFSPQFNRKFLSIIKNAKERSEFAEDFKAVQLERNQSIDPDQFLSEWLKAQKAAKEGGLSPELQAFLNS